MNRNGNTKLADVARRYREARLSVIPIAATGAKMPASEMLPTVWDDTQKKDKATWKPFQDRIATDDELGRWFDSNARVGCAILGGAVSGGLEILDIDEPGIVEEYFAAVEEWCPSLLARLPIVRTPKGGRHVYFRCETIAGNQKLAQKPVTEKKVNRTTGEEVEVVKPEALIETRGEGGYVVAPGSHLDCHYLHKPYEHISGPPLTEIPRIQPQEREAPHRVARAFNRYIESSKIERGGARDNRVQDRHRARNDVEGDRPGDDYNNRAEWPGILTPHGWTIAKTSGQVKYWKRPGSAHPYGARMPGHGEKGQPHDRRGS